MVSLIRSRDGVSNTIERGRDGRGALVVRIDEPGTRGSHCAREVISREQERSCASGNQSVGTLC